MGLYSSVSEINIDFGRKSQNFPSWVFYRPRWNWVKPEGLKKRAWWVYQAV